MFIERVREKFGATEPIFTEELLALFSDYSRVQAFRFINKAKENGELIQYDKGVYFIPKQTILGQSTITADMVVEKKYLRSEKNIYGVYSGIKLFNTFSMTTQMPAVVEVVTNNESAKYREIQVKNRRFILRRSRCRIDQDNAAAYTVLQLFSEFSQNDRLNEDAKKRLLRYMETKKVTNDQLISLSTVFPSRVAQNLIWSGILK